LSLVLLVGALLFSRTLRNLLTVDPGFRSAGVVVASIDLRPLGTPADGRRGARRDVIDRISALPGVESVAHAAIVPISGDSRGNDVWVERNGFKRGINALFNQTSRGFFNTLRIPILAGRDFDPVLDTPAAPLVAIVNEAFARAVLNGANAVGTRLTVEATPSRPEQTFQVVGLVKDAKYMSLREVIMPGVFLADSQESRPAQYAQLLVRSSLPAETVASEITRSLAELNPRIAVTYTVMTTQIADTLVRERLMATLSGFFGGLAAVLTLIGLYGVIAYTVARRTNEIGIRMALGASRGTVLSMILREAGLLVSIGITVGIGLALAGGSAAAALLFGLKPYDPLTLAFAAALLSAVAFVASYVPARAASKIEPMVALRID
jgi:putative ABC transport system permease protein